jgi:S-DNA-T family DNA segregation ATPase FtsK/SpoIIIE
MSLDITDSDLPRLLPETLEKTVRGWLARSAGAMLVLVSLSGWLCLVTWSIGDPSLSRAAGQLPRNLLGPFGAIVSDLLLQTLGIAALFALAGPLFWGAELFSARLIPRLRAKLVLFPVAVLALAGGCSGLPTLPSWPLGSGFGGLLGDLVFNVCSTALAALNPESAGALAGLALLAGGLGLITHSIGLSTSDLAAMALSKGGRKPVVPNWVRWPVVRSPFKRASRIEPELPMREDIQLRPQPSPPSWYAGLAGWSRNNRRTSVGVIRDDYDPGSRGPEFDDETDENVREVAKRFAPKSKHARVEDTTQPQVPDLPRVFEIDRAGPGYDRPSINLLRHQAPPCPVPEAARTALKENGRLLEGVLADFGIKGEVKEIRPGPVVTLFEFEPARGVKSSRIIGLADDIARSMSATGVRVAVVPGRNAIGIEVPNARREAVHLREILDSEPFRTTQATLPIALGKSIGGEVVLADLARMPHLLVAGTTGSGKSVGINAMILSLLFKLDPARCRLLLIDPKMLELTVYNHIPHLLAPVVTDPAQAVAALNWAVGEMEERYKRMSKLGVRNIEAFNRRLRQAKTRGEILHRTVQTGFDPRTGAAIYEREALELEPLPYIVIVVDEFADLMAVAGKEIEAAVQRLAQMARAAGIHLIMATQRPSVDIITGTIKANFPTRISFKVPSKTDSRTILNEQGAEQLLGRGDMLFSGGSEQALRVHGAFVSDEEVEAVAQQLRRAGEPNYVAAIAELGTTAAQIAPETSDDEEDLYTRAVALVLRQRKPTISYLQRRLGIGYNRAASIMERMEEEAIVGPANHIGKREILASGPDQEQP